MSHVGQRACSVILMTFPMNKIVLLLCTFAEDLGPRKRQAGQRKIVSFDFRGGKYIPQIITQSCAAPPEELFLKNPGNDGDPNCPATSYLLLDCCLPLFRVAMPRLLHVSPDSPCHLPHGLPRDALESKVIVQGITTKSELPRLLASHT